MQTTAPYRAEFARLTPENRPALVAFDQVASKLKADPNWNRHARKYMAILPGKENFEFVNSESESEGGSGPRTQKRLIWRGFYRFNFDMPPRDPRFGWVLGGGKFANGDESPDLVLTERKSHDLVFGRHARLFHNYSSGALILHTAKQSITFVDGKEVRPSITIWSIVTHITFGNLTYRLHLHGEVESAHRSRLARYQQSHGLTVNDFPVSLLSTPAESDYIHKHYIIKNPIGHGASSTVFAGEHMKTNAVVAIKRITRNRSNAGLIEQEHRLCQLVDKMSPDGDRRSAHFRNSDFDEVYLVYRPLAIATWLSLCEPGPISDAHNAISTKLFRQCLEGTEYIHSKDVIHRDIKPGNLAIVSFNPPHGRVIDSGSARIGASSDVVQGNTLSYRSLEIWRLERGGKNSGLQYDETVDIFAFGVSAYQIFCKQRIWWGKEANEVALGDMRDEYERRDAVSGGRSAPSQETYQKHA
ncbi:MAG: hypothetical protein ALECFALPRED_004346 [Alectoria fallacina]|uniref:Protein kinase domain-containing protein n=1 Tax=Alectoria fallacina TaxID=1903189 RepID=A0A8H3EK54_9LECA|nr:MAG: hypothetical protein ALECFALPRED_004346 [Alectoria fallacina]